MRLEPQPSFSEANRTIRSRISCAASYNRKGAFHSVQIRCSSRVSARISPMLGYLTLVRLVGAATVLPMKTGLSSDLYFIASDVSCFQ